MMELIWYVLVFLRKYMYQLYIHWKQDRKPRKGGQVWHAKNNNNVRLNTLDNNPTKNMNQIAPFFVKYTNSNSSRRHQRKFPPHYGVVPHRLPMTNSIEIMQTTYSVRWNAIDFKGFRNWTKKPLLHGCNGVGECRLGSKYRWAHTKSMVLKTTLVEDFL
jgi:hypothetical protein